MTEKKHASRIFSLRRCLISALCFSSSVPKPTGKHRALSRTISAPVTHRWHLVWFFRLSGVNCSTVSEEKHKIRVIQRLPHQHFTTGRENRRFHQRFQILPLLHSENLCSFSRVLKQISLFLRCKGDGEKGFVF